MKNTVRDFWKMIVDYKVSAVVMLCGIEENGKVSSVKNLVITFFVRCISSALNIHCMCIIIVLVK